MRWNLWVMALPELGTAEAAAWSSRFRFSESYVVLVYSVGIGYAMSLDSPINYK